MPPPLLAVAHGSSDPEAAVIARAIVEGCGLEARLAFLDHAGPRPAEVLERYAADGAGEVVVLPLLLSHAGHARADIASLTHPDLTLLHGQAMGPHPLLAAIARDRLADRPPGLTLLVAAAGTRDAAANDAVSELAGSLGGTACFASLATPSVPDAAASLKGPIALLPYFLSWGRLPRQAVLDAAPAWIAEPLGADPRIGNVLAQRYAEARVLRPRPGGSR